MARVRTWSDINPRHTLKGGVAPLSVTHPWASSCLVDPRIAEVVPAGSSLTVLWVCDEGHELPAIVKHRVNGHRCAVCTGVLTVPGETDLLARRPDLFTQLVNPDDARGVPICSTSVKLRWRCEFGHEYLQSPYKRLSRGYGCPTCSGRTLIVGVNDLATTDPALTGRLVDPGLATTLRRGSTKKVMWKCDAGHCWPASPLNMRRYSQMSGGGCGACAVYGFNATEPAYLYWLEHHDGWLKVGVTNVGTRVSRVGAFEMAGWTKVGLVEFQSGAFALEVERRLLRAIRNVSEPLTEEAKAAIQGLKAMGRLRGVTEIFRTTDAVLQVVRSTFSAQNPT